MNPYPCHNHPRRAEIVSEHMVQDGWTEDGRRVMRPHRTEWTLVQCCHDQPEKDERCAGCAWIRKEE